MKLGNKLKLLIVRGHFYRRNGLNTWEYMATNYSNSYAIKVIAAFPTRHEIKEDLPYETEQLFWLDGWLKLFNREIIYTILRKLRLPVGCLVGLSKRCREYDIVQVSENYTLFSFIAALTAKILVVNSAENIPFPIFQHNIVTFWIKKFVNQRVKAVITTSPLGRRALIHEGIPYEIVHVVPNSISCPVKSSVREQENRDDVDTVRFVFVGRLCEQKGISYLLDAFSELEVSCASELHFVGKDDGGYLKRLDTINNCHYHGPLDYFKVQSLLLKMDVLVLPSTTQRDNEEQFGMVILEAMCAGLPTVVTDVGGMPYVVSPNKTSLVVEERNAEALRKAMEKLSNDKQLRLEMGRNAKEYVYANYHPKIIAESLDSIYQSLVK